MTHQMITKSCICVKQICKQFYSVFIVANNFFSWSSIYWSYQSIKRDFFWRLQFFISLPVIIFAIYSYLSLSCFLTWLFPSENNDKQFGIVELVFISIRRRFLIDLEWNAIVVMNENGNAVLAIVLDHRNFKKIDILCDPLSSTKVCD